MPSIISTIQRQNFLILSRFSRLFPGDSTTGREAVCSAFKVTFSDSSGKEWSLMRISGPLTMEFFHRAILNHAACRVNFNFRCSSSRTRPLDSSQLFLRETREFPRRGISINVRLFSTPSCPSLPLYTFWRFNPSDTSFPLAVRLTYFRVEDRWRT